MSKAVDDTHSPGRQWALDASHTTTQRARIFAELAFADFANDRHDLTTRAAFRIAEAIEKYDALDAAQVTP